MSHSSTNPLPYVLTLAALAACVMVKSHPEVRHAPPPGANVTPPPAAQPNVAATSAVQRRVVLVSVDGMSAGLVHAQMTVEKDHVKTIVDVMPHLERMFAEGAGTMKALVPQGHTTAISHAVLFTGAEPSVNGVVCEPDEGVCKGYDMSLNKGYHSPTFRWTPLQVKDTLFTAVQAAGYTPVAAVQKGKLVGEFRQDGDETGIISVNDTRKVVETGCDAVKDDKIRLAVLHFKMIDDAGHHDGWLSDRQYKEAAIIDDQLQEVRDCVDRANAAGGVQTVLIVTADHGGTPSGGHCGRQFDNDDTWLVPWVAVGPGIKRGYEIVGRSDLKPARGGVIQPTILLIDTVPTILALLGIPETSIPTLSKDAHAVAEILSPTAQ